MSGDEQGRVGLQGFPGGLFEGHGNLGKGGRRQGEPVDLLLRGIAVEHGPEPVHGQYEFALGGDPAGPGTCKLRLDLQDVRGDSGSPFDKSLFHAGLAGNGFLGFDGVLELFPGLDDFEKGGNPLKEYLLAGEFQLRFGALEFGLCLPDASGGPSEIGDKLSSSDGLDIAQLGRAGIVGFADVLLPCFRTDIQVGVPGPFALFEPGHGCITLVFGCLDQFMPVHEFREDVPQTLGQGGSRHAKEADDEHKKCFFHGMSEG